MAPARAQARVIAAKEIAPPIALCIFEIAQGHPERHKEQGLVLRSSADETGYLLSAGNKKAVDHSVANRCPGKSYRQVYRDAMTKLVKRREEDPAGSGRERYVGESLTTMGESPRRHRGVIMTTAEFGSTRCVRALEIASLNIVRSKDFVDHARSSSDVSPAAAGALVVLPATCTSAATLRVWSSVVVRPATAPPFLN